MNGIKITYWITTVLVAAMMTFSAYMYLTAPVMAAGFHHLGYPDYFRVELAIAKLIGVIGLLAPIPPRLKEWVYAGFVITFCSAVIAHTQSGDPVTVWIMPLIFIIVVLISYFTYHRLLEGKVSKKASV